MKQIKLPYNSAKRLFTILNKTHVIGQERPDLSIREIFASAMQTKKTPTAFYAAWAKLFELIDRLKKDLLQLPEAKSFIYKEAIQEIIKIISLTDSSHNWEGSTELNLTLNNPNWVGFHLLKLCALELGSQENEIAPDKLRKFQSEIEVMLQEVQDANLNIKLKYFLEEHLADLQEKIEFYHFCGTEGLKKSVEASLGALLIKKYEFEQYSELEQTLIQHFLTFLKYILDTLVPANLRLPDKILDPLTLRVLKHYND